MKYILSLVFGAVLLFGCAIPGIAPDPQQALIGQWRSFAFAVISDEIDGISSLEFYQDGSVVVRLKTSGEKVVLEGQYKFLDQRSLQLKFEQADPMLVSFLIDDDKLTLTSLNGEDDGTVFLRARQ